MYLNAPKEITTLSKKVERVGSRVTCYPAPTNTDEDWLVLTATSDDLCKLEVVLRESGYEQDTGDIEDYTGETEVIFKSFRKGEINVILTFNEAFFDLFMTATHIAKRFNLKHKGDRIALFQAVLYGNRI